MAIEQGDVSLLDRALGEQPLERGVRVTALRDQEQAGDVEIEAMNDVRLAMTRDQARLHGVA